MTDKLKPVWERERWGRHLNNDFFINRDNKKGNPILLQNYFAPEGSRLIARCKECGGVFEALVDMRSFKSIFEPRPYSNASIHMRDVWRPQHEDCADNPKQWEIPKMCAEMMNRQLDEYRDSFMSKPDFEVFGHTMVVSAKGTMYYVPIADIPYGETRRSEAEARKFAVRELLKENDDSVLFQLTIMEAWSVQMPVMEERTDIEPRYNPFRTEIIGITVETPEFTRTGNAPVIRVNRKDVNAPAYDKEDFSGPAEVGEFKWGDYTESHLIEGFIAANNRFV